MDYDKCVVDSLVLACEVVVRDIVWIQQMCHGKKEDRNFCWWPGHIIVRLRQPLLEHAIPWNTVAQFCAELMINNNIDPIGINAFSMQQAFIDKHIELVQKLKENEKNDEGTFQIIQQM